MKAYETLRHTITKPIEDKTNQNEKTRSKSKRRDTKKLHPIQLPTGVLIKNQNNNNGRVCNTKKINQGNVINKIEINKVKLNVLLINSI